MDADGVQVYVDRDVIAVLGNPTRLSFVFGRFGRCWLHC
jgi:hypothetical protein